ncbi:hypothetical protein AVEN_67196-1 [Araneus ventricosus]|uniref:DUF4371 domain-containing protein n=1 Tax=Araneus ventricosus TaxID=182803 RepID=A0A4Y2SDU5_ARAVE|nr:hypothetical protein AVEN_67196-1 [Araneus ventricosus]
MKSSSCIKITSNVNNSVDAEDTVLDPNDTKEPQEAEMMAKPEFTIEIKKGSKMLSFHCTFSQAVPEDDPGTEPYNDVFQISDISIHEGEFEDHTYLVSGDIMDGVSIALNFCTSYYGIDQSLLGSKQVSNNATLSLNDRRANQEAVLACFVAEISLLFSLMPKLVELCQILAKDRPALSKLKMERTAATYITGHGVAKTMREELVAKLNKNYFSMNVDEATNNNGDKIIHVLVRVYDDEKEKIITAHLGSRKENISTANNIFLHLKELLDSNEISFS